MLHRRLVPLPLITATLVASCGAGHPGAARGVASGSVAATTDSAFVRDVLDPGRPAVVYYWATGCIPCVFLGPHVKRLAAKYSGRVVFWKLNWGWSAARVRRYGVPAIPTLVFYRNGAEITRLVGMPGGATDDSLARFVEDGLARSR